METNFNLCAYICLIIATLFSFISVWKQSRTVESISFLAIGLSCLSLTLFLALRAWNLGRLPFVSVYEFTFCFSWGILVLYIFTRRKIKVPLLTLFVSLINLALFSVGNTFSPESRPLVPALQSIWLQFHVATSVVAYGGFALSFCLGILYLLKSSRDDSRHDSGLVLPGLEKIDEMIHWSVVIGFSFMTLVLITGSVWAEQVWGSWWSWDPKETWALITWLIYAVYLHARKTCGWQGKKAAVLVIIGFAAVLFTLFGVTLFLPGAHSYS